MIACATKLHRYSETGKEAVQWMILGTQMTNKKNKMKQYSNILKVME